VARLLQATGTDIHGPRAVPRDRAALREHVGRSTRQGEAEEVKDTVMYADNVERAVTEVVAEVSEKPEEELWAQRNSHLFEEVGLDSLLALEIVATLERKYRIEVPEERIVDVTTLSAAIDLVKEMLREQGKLEAAL
jgi:acyl carrier protein